MRGDLWPRLCIALGMVCCITYFGYPIGMPLIVAGFGELILKRLEVLSGE